MSLNPRDRNHGWAIKLLEQAKGHDIKIFISPASLIELSLVLKSRGLTEGGINRFFAAMRSLISRYTKPYFPDITFDVVSKAAELRMKHSLSFFDSIHAAIALTEDLEYYDLDELVRETVKAERGKS